MEGVFGVEVSKAREKEESLCGVSRSKLTGVEGLHRSCRGWIGETGLCQCVQALGRPLVALDSGQSHGRLDQG